MSHEAPANGNGTLPPLRNTTRYLSAAAYLDEHFRDRVLKELLGDPHRAVAPSYGGFDLTPVLSHCLRAQRMVLIRDALITAAVLLLCLIGGFWTWASLLLPLALLSLPRLRQGPLVWRVLLVVWAVVSLMTALGTVIWASIVALVSTLFFTGEADDLPGGLSPLVLLAGSLLFNLLLNLTPMIIAVGYRVHRYLALTTELGPGATARTDDDTGQQQERRAYLDQAQGGNITLFGADNPFIGAGLVRRSWSIVVEMDRLTHSANTPSATPRKYVQIDPVNLHAFVRQRLLEMRDAVNAAPERITQMHVADHLIARGTFTRLDWPGSGGPSPWKGQSHPLINSTNGLPRFTAPTEMAAEVARQPQGGLKHYQRVTVCTDGQEMIGSDRLLLAPGEDREIVVSAFIHLAVEGRMLYTQFVLTVLPPTAAAYRIVDELPTLSRPTIVWRAISRGWLNLIADMLFAPFRLLRSGIRTIRWQQNTRNPADFPVYPFGARESVRELGARRDLGGFIQRLDADKYGKLIERRFTEAVLDYLEAHGVDTREYRAQATNLINNGTLITGGTFNGPMAAGPEASATQYGGNG